MYRLKYFEITP